jgi:hypothetical protein
MKTKIGGSLALSIVVNRDVAGSQRDKASRRENLPYKSLRKPLRTH